jgi:hypothetical protein
MINIDAQKISLFVIWLNILVCGIILCFLISYKQGKVSKEEVYEFIVKACGIFAICQCLILACIILLKT